MTLGMQNHVVSMAVVKSDDLLLTVTEKGMGKTSVVRDYTIHHRGSKGVKTINLTKKSGYVVSVRKVNDGDELMLVSNSGKIIRIQVNSIRQTGRAAQGVKVMELKDDDRVAAVEPVNPDGVGSEEDMPYGEGNGETEQ